MSRHNRDRRDRKWRCAECGAPMQRASAEAAKKLLAGADGKPPDPRDIIHQCGGCRALHFEEPDRMRPLTPAEVFRFNVEAPAVVGRLADVGLPDTLTVWTQPNGVTPQ